MASLRSISDAVQSFLPVSESLRRRHRDRIEAAVDHYIPLVSCEVEIDLPPLPVQLAPKGERFWREVVNNVDMVHSYEETEGSKLTVYAPLSTRGLVRFPSAHAWDYRVVHELGHHVWCSTKNFTTINGQISRGWYEGFAEYLARDHLVHLYRSTPVMPSVMPDVFVAGLAIVRHAVNRGVDPLDIPIIWPEL